MFDDRAATKRALQISELREAPKCDVERGLELAGVVSIENDESEDTSLGRLMNVARVLGIEKCDDRTCCLMNDRGDLLERVLAIESQSHERNLCASASTERPNVTDIQAARDDLMAEPFDGGLIQAAADV